MTFGQYIWRVLVGFDRFLNGLRGGNPAYTISQDAARARKDGKLWGCILCKILDWFDKDHCTKSMRGYPDNLEVGG